jgi:alkylation response protein AidB-like acyl-CoA dehydrogenase
MSDPLENSDSLELFEGARLDSRDRELIGVARELGLSKFADRAPDYDVDARFPFENYVDLAECGFLGLCIPQRYGGLGASYRSYALVAAELGRHCGATALTFNMHSCTMLWSGTLADDLDMTPAERDEQHRHRAGIYAEVIENHAIFAQPFSEGTGAGAGSNAFGTTATPCDGGWRVNGKKVFASLSGAANYFGLLCTEAASNEDLDFANTLYLAVPSDVEGVSIVGDWDPLGMRATVSRTLLFEDVFVPSGRQLMPRGAYARAANEWPHMFFTLSPTYLGIAHAALDFTRRYLRGEVPGASGSPKAQSPTKQLAFAEMFVKFQQARALFFQVIDEAGPRPTVAAQMRLLAAQFTVMEHANDIARLAIRTCGGHSMLKSFPLERYYRDSRCGSLMLPWTAEICLERIGRQNLLARSGSS